jgi:hypothetical protein
MPVLHSESTDGNMSDMKSGLRYQWIELDGLLTDSETKKRSN